MPANRSRTLEWRRCLQQIHQRGGALEIAVSHAAERAEIDSRHLVWRVRLLDLNDRELVVEQPMALGQLIQIDRGIQLVAVLAIGQNRWMFATTHLGPTEFKPRDGRGVSALRLTLPQSVERCQRRHHLRVETVALTLPEVDAWPLLDPKSVIVAERACELHAQQEAELGLASPAVPEFDCDAVMPEVGPQFKATLMNLGGGGVGMRIAGQDSQVLARHKVLWLRLKLPPFVRTPICATGKVVHTHIESNHDVYVGMAFDFSFNPSHQRFVIDQICRHIQMQQRWQQEKSAATRRTA